ncbi:Low-salt glycan biosynthesis hexosyltransferase Agl9 [Planktothrix tepida]|uniref:Glycosyl transferase group 1 n=1 Tax=Planktothrix tepida PCC 9214 TaxID=671072 RepID=A0A1J1LJH5_9CYAN|nr:glycosyltransferase [Planktothrix tepida]CAD5933417.1 Low-salt glycan biosynthesis hexosyltransferase Agl9 [Planktothrix tepida]CUR31729.1 Glycosyl transferase group 1 [Planktothrix tepida PCC 9214]
MILFSKIHVLMLPDFRQDNPYQSLLTEGLAQEKIHVEFSHYYLNYFPILRGALKHNFRSVNIVHLHWLEFYIKAPKKFPKLLVCLKFLLDIILVRMLGLKIVWTVHNQFSHDDSFPELERWTRGILSWLVDGIIFHSYSSLKLVDRVCNFNKKKSIIIPHGHYRDVYDVPINSSESRKRLGLPLAGRIYMNIGYLKPYKKIEKLITIWKNNQDFFTDDTLVIVGKPVNKSYYLELEELSKNIPGLILIPEFVEPHNIPTFLSAADVIVFPFEKILTSGSLILAMSYNKPIIAPDLGGIAETLGVANQLLYDPKDEQGLLKALQKSTTLDLQALSLLVKQECDDLDWGLIAKKTAEFYQFILCKY